ncbi:unnamed protein product [Cylindrotheca closterium]|uniref:RanBP2-type domain-containing protein n=1 Tax=Cylindrotheca closterium TaxID=2856 RepID=A0AAD2CPH7_9STRA|nr:unnamed protein product [Cylindrotheca closterium]
MMEPSNWKCSQCTLENPISRRRCDACRARKPIESSTTTTTTTTTTNSNSNSNSNSTFTSNATGTGKNVTESDSKSKKSIKKTNAAASTKAAIKLNQNRAPLTSTRKPTRKRKRPTSIQKQPQQQPQVENRTEVYIPANLQSESSSAPYSTFGREMETAPASQIRHNHKEKSKATKSIITPQPRQEDQVTKRKRPILESETTSPSAANDHEQLNLTAAPKSGDATTPLNRVPEFHMVSKITPTHKQPGKQNCRYETLTGKKEEQRLAGLNSSSKSQEKMENSIEANGPPHSINNDAAGGQCSNIRKCDWTEPSKPCNLVKIHEQTSIGGFSNDIQSPTKKPMEPNHHSVSRQIITHGTFMADDPKPDIMVTDTKWKSLFSISNDPTHKAKLLMGCRWKEVLNTKGCTEKGHPMAPNNLGFRTVGSGTAVSVSEEAMAKASRFLDSSNTNRRPVGEEPDTNRRPVAEEPDFEASEAPQAIHTICFRTAGSGTAVSVSEEAMAKASRFLDNANTNRRRVAEESAVQRSDIAKPISTMGFRTAGSGIPVSVSEEAVAKATTLLESSTSYSPIAEESEVQRSEIAQPISTIGFRTAGSGTAVSVSEEAMAKASRFLDSSNTNRRPEGEEPDTNRRPVAEEPDFEASEAPQAIHTICFRTAGSGTAVSVSEEAMAKASRFLDNANTNRRRVAEESAVQRSDIAKPISTMGFRTAGSGIPVSVSEEAVAKATTLLESSTSYSPIAEESEVQRSEIAQPISTIGFRTAGSGTAVSVSEEAMAKASRFLDSSNTNRRPEGEEPDTNRRPVAEEPDFEASEAPQAIHTICFRTAGSGTAVSVSEEAMAKASRFLDNANTNRRRVAEESAVQRSDIAKPISTMGFRTAGSGIPVSVSEEAVAKATTLLESSTSYSPIAEESEVQRSEIAQPISTIGFRTAGSGTAVSVSEEAMAKASRFLDSSNTNRRPEGEEPDTNRRPVAEEPDFEASEAPQAIHTICFRTAGSGTAVSVSEEAMAKASRFLDNANTNRRRVAEESAVQRSDIAKPISTMGFRTAGSGIPVSVSEEAVAKATTLLESSTSYSPIAEESEVQRSEIAQPISTIGFRTAGSGTAVSVSEEAMAKASRFLDSSNTNRRPEGEEPDTNRRPVAEEPDFEASEALQAIHTICFRTAGSGTVVSVSEEAMAKASRFLDNANTNRRPVAEEPDFEASEAPQAIYTIGFRTVGSGTGVSVSEEAIARASRFLDSSNTNRRPVAEEPDFEASKAPQALPVIGFRTAGSGNAVSVSEEAMANASRFLDSSNTNRKPGAVESTVEAREAPQAIHTICFRTAGSGTVVSVSEEAMAKASKFLDNANTNRRPVAEEPDFEASEAPQAIYTIGFRTAGSGTGVSVSEEAIAKASSFLESSNTNRKAVSEESTFEAHKAPQALPVIGFRTAGSGIAVSVSEEAIARASRFLDSSNTNRRPIAEEPDFEASEAPQAKEELSKTTSLLDIGAKSTAMDLENLALSIPTTKVGFSTAGRCASISVPEEEITGATKLLLSARQNTISDESLIESGAVSNVPAMVGPREADMGTGISISDEELNRSSAGEETSRNVVLEGPSNENFLSSLECRSLSGIGRARTKLPAARSSVISDAFLAPVPKSKRTIKQGYRNGNQVTPAFFSQESALLAAETEEHNWRALSPLISGRPQEYSIVGLAPSVDRLERNRDTGSHKARSMSLLRNKSLLARTEGSKTKGHESDDANYRMLSNLETPRNDILQANSIRLYADGHSPDFKQKLNLLPSECGTIHPMNSEWKAQVPSSSLPNSMKTTPALTRPKRRAITMSRDTTSKIRQRERNHSPSVTPLPINFVAAESDIDSEKRHIEQRSCSAAPLEKRTLQQSVDLGDLTDDSAICKKHGVSEATLCVTSQNASRIMFDIASGSPLTIDSKISCGEFAVGSIADIREALVSDGCKLDSLTESWVTNHKRWIVWKLASYERSFPRHLGGFNLTYETLISRLKRRYRRELRGGLRPATRMILNRDVAASSMVILAVSQIILPTDFNFTHLDNEELANQIRVELTDGWYPILAKLDGALVRLVRDSVIAIGSKLLVSNARLRGAEDGMEPLEGRQDPCSPQSAVFLELHANSTRLAKWNAKLGFVRSENGISKGRLLVKKLSDVILGGGDIPSICIFVLRRYPLLYFEKSPTVDSCAQAKSAVLTQTEEDERRRSYEKRVLAVMERMTASLQSAVEKEIDEDAPEIWKQVMETTFPEDTICALSDPDKARLLEWKEKRGMLIRSRLKQEVEAEIECETSLVRESVPFIRMRVHSLDLSGYKDEEAILTIWQPTNEQLRLLQDGCGVQIENLSVRNSKYEGMLQLTGSSRTSMQACAVPWSMHDKLNDFCRRNLSLYDVHLRSHHATGEDQERQFEFDTIVILLKYEELDDKTVGYVIDEFNILLRIEGENQRFPKQLLTCSRSNKFEVLGFCDLKLLPFDTDKNCAVARFRDSSRLHTTTSSRSEELNAWSMSEDGSHRLQRMSHYLNAEISPWQNANLMPAFGYVVGLKTQSPDSYVIEVDCSSSDSEKWEVSTSLLEQAIPLARKNESALTEEEVERCAWYAPFAELIHARGLLWHFRLTKISQNSDFGCEYQVISMEAACAGSLGRLYM